MPHAERGDECEMHSMRNDAYPRGGGAFVGIRERSATPQFKYVRWHRLIYRICIGIPAVKFGARGLVRQPASGRCRLCICGVDFGLAHCTKAITRSLSRRLSVSPLTYPTPTLICPGTKRPLSAVKPTAPCGTQKTASGRGCVKTRNSSVFGFHVIRRFASTQLGCLIIHCRSLSKSTVW